MPCYEPEVGNRIVKNDPEAVHCDLDALMDNLVRHGIDLERLRVAIECGRIAVTTYPLLSYRDVARWFKDGMP